MQFAPRNALLPCLVVAVCAVSAMTGAVGADLEALPAHNADIEESSVSGLSSGAFMAVQFGTAWSSIIKGIGVVAGGPFYCAQRSVTTATNDCMKGPPPAQSVFTGMADRSAAAGHIDPTDNLRRQKVYVFHGFNDGTVAESVTRATVGFYDHYLGNAGRGNLFYQTTLGAGHAFVLAQPPQTAKDCSVTATPYIDRCGYAQAGVILRHIYGALAKPHQPNELTGAVKSFSQESYARPDTPGALSMGNEGYVYVPKECEGTTGPACRVHVVLHGCLQDANDVGREVVDKAGFNEWADTNRLIVLYPQTTARPLMLPFQPFNPLACWDWWGYVTNDDTYVAKPGRQITAIKKMLDALTSKYRPQPPVSSTPGTAPAALEVIDASDKAAALVWAPMSGAEAYRVWRAGADAAFAPVASVAGPSFSDRGLAAGSSYRWRVTAVVNGVEGPAAETTATTKATPPRCDRPGTCPVTLAPN